MNTFLASILVVDDDEDLRNLLQQYLSQENFDVKVACDGGKMDAFLLKYHFNIIILDLMMPSEDGLSILRRLRPMTNTPIIILSAKGQDTDRIIGLEVGADDYMCKPFNPRELLARIRALLRRNPLRKLPNDHIFNFGGFQYNKLTNALLEDKQTIKLTESENLILKLFIAQPNVTLSRDNIIDALHGRDRDPFDRSIDIHITRLRKKLEKDPTNPAFIQTVWAKGYKFTPNIDS